MVFLDSKGPPAVTRGYPFEQKIPLTFVRSESGITIEFSNLLVPRLTISQLL
jgi:hypothetical protein